MQVTKSFRLAICLSKLAVQVEMEKASVYNVELNFVDSRWYNFVNFPAFVNFPTWLKRFKPLFHWTILVLRGNVILSNFSAKEKHFFWAILALKSTVLLSNFSAEKHCFTPGVLLSDFSAEKHCFAEQKWECQMSEN